MAVPSPWVELQLRVASTVGITVSFASPHSCGRRCGQCRRHRWRIRKLLWVWPRQWLWLRLRKWLWVWWWCLWPFQQQNYLHHHPDQEIQPVEETMSLQPPEPSWAQPWCVCAFFTTTSILPFWGSSDQCHLTAREGTLPSWGFVTSFHFGLGDPPGKGWVSADSSSSHGQRRTPSGASQGHMCPLPAQCHLLADPRCPCTAGPTPSPSPGSNWPCEVRTTTTQSHLTLLIPFIHLWVNL